MTSQASLADGEVAGAGAHSPVVEEAPPHDEELSDRQKAVLDLYPPTRSFAVISWGAAATAWTARALNSHPEVLCVHGANLYWDSLGNTERLDGITYMRIIASLGHSYRAAGDVHGVSRETLPDVQRALGSRFQAAILVREPATRLASQLALFARYHHTRQWNVDYLDSMLEGLPLPDDRYETKLFVHGVSLLNSIIVEQPLARVFRAEDITSSAQHFADFASFLIGDEVPLSEDWSRKAVAAAPINTHRSAGSAELLPWQRETIRMCLQEEAIDAYRQLGYTVSFE